MKNSVGWGNGYVILPKNHPVWGWDYDKIHAKYNINVNGGLTFSSPVNVLLGSESWPELKEKHKDGWIIGFDTMHYGDSIDIWPKEEVLRETEYLKEQMINIREYKIAKMLE